MDVLDYCYELLTKLKNKEISFGFIINKKINFLDIDSNLIDPVKDALKAVVNRYFFLSWEIKHYLKGISLTEQEVDYLIISLAFLRYARNIKSEDFLAMIQSKLDQINSNLDRNLINQMLNELKLKATTIPKSFSDNFTRKVSLNYSYPEWLIAMMRKHFGTKNTYKSVFSSRKSTPISLSSNELLVEQIDHPSFNKTEATKNSYFYVGKKKLFEEELFEKHQLFLFDQSEQVVLEDLEIDIGERILMIGDFEPPFITGACIKIQDLGKVRVGVNSYDTLMTDRKIVSKFEFKSFEAFESPINLICTHSTNDNSRVILLPKNSEFGLIRKKPEVLLAFKKDEIDGLIENQLNSLKEASNFVCDDGELDYIVPTINKKETFMIVREFLNENPYFELISERMIFPYEFNGEGIYYARIRKLGK